MLVMTSREQQVLSIVRDDPLIPQRAIAKRLGITRSAVAGHIMNLTRKGLIKGRGYVLSDAPYVALAGGANVDIHGRSSQPVLTKDSNPGHVQIAAGGVARNVAENLARLGIATRLFSAVGDDQHGKYLLRACREAGVDVQGIQQLPAGTTSTYLSIVDHDGEMLLGVNDMQILEQLRVESLQAFAPLLKNAALLVVDTNLPAAVLAWLFEIATDVPVFVDTVSAAKAPRLQPHLQHVHTLKTGVIEAEALTGLKANTPLQLQKVADRLHSDGVRRVFVTRGDKGVFYSDGQSRGTDTPQRRKRPVRNAGGAGDAFLAGLAYAWLQQMDLADSIRFALATAELTLAHPGTNRPDLSAEKVNEAMLVQYA